MSAAGRPDRPWMSWVERPSADPPGPEEPPHPAEEAAGSSGPGIGPAPGMPIGAYAGPTPGGPTPAGPRLLTVGDLTRLVKETVRSAGGLRNVWVEGEVGQVSVSAAGHCYFTLKDADAQLRCVLFRDERRFLAFEPQTGLRVVAHGRVDVFEQQGTYQLYVDTLQPAGFGDLALRVEALKAKLAAEGLFEAARKRSIPARPAIVGIVTSRSGAVLHDMVQVLRRRWPLVRVVLAPCQVQGDAAPASIVAALRRLGRWLDPATGRPVDVLILARGGGSLEDLWPFNDERVVRAVAAHPVPVVVGVGHETDVTLAEFAADVRAATPSVAAELVVPSRVDEAAALLAMRARLATAVGRQLRQASEQLGAERRALEQTRPSAVLAAERERVGHLLDRAARAVGDRLSTDRIRLERAHERLPTLVSARLARARLTLDSAAASLSALGPYATLERGYAIVRTPDGTIVRDASTQTPGAPLEVRLARGELDVTVERVSSTEAADRAPGS